MHAGTAQKHHRPKLDSRWRKHQVRNGDGGGVGCVANYPPHLLRWEFEWGSWGGPFLRAVWFRLPQTSASAVLLAPHLFGELAKTARGCTMLKASGYFRHFIDTIKSEESTAIQKRAGLWAIGQVPMHLGGARLVFPHSVVHLNQIGSSNRGFSLFEDTGVLEHVSKQAKDCNVLSMRGKLLCSRL